MSALKAINWIGALEKQILSIATGGCTCDTKSPDLTFHAPRCHYLMASNALGMMEELRDEFSDTQSEIARLREALTPSADTKAAYMGEFYMGVVGGDEEHRSVQVPWTTIKEIMAAILAKAEGAQP